MFDIFVLRPPSITPMWVANSSDPIAWMAKPKYKKRSKDMMIATDNTGNVRSFAYVINSKNIRTYEKRLMPIVDYESTVPDHYAWNSVYEDFIGYTIIHRIYEFSNYEERDAKATQIILVLARMIADVIFTTKLDKKGYLEAIQKMDVSISPRSIRLGIVNIDEMNRVALYIIKLWTMTNPSYFPPKSNEECVKLRNLYTSDIVYGVAHYQIMNAVRAFEYAVGIETFAKILKHYLPLEKFLEIL